MKKTTKIITLILSALLLIGCAIGISVSAEENAPAVTVKYKNISYEGAVKVLYAVEATNVPEGAEVKMAFFDKMPESENAAPDYIKDEYADEIEIDGASYKVFFSDGIAPKNMRKNIYAVPVILDGDTLIARGDVVTYSIYTYGVNMLSKAPTEEQKALYASLLDYGASVQRLLLGTDDYTEDDFALAGGYADEYCGVKISTVVDNSITADGELLGYFAPGTAVELTAPLYENGAMFTGYTNGDREIVGEYAAEATAYATEPGVTSFYKTYRSDISVNDYSKGYISTSKYYVYTNSIGYTNNYIVGTGTYNSIVNYGTEEAPNYALKHSHTAGKSSESIYYNYNTVGEAYVFETDFCFDGTTGTSNDGDAWQGRLGFVSAKTSGRSSEKNFTAYSIMYAKDNAPMYIEGAEIPVGEWVRLRLEFIPLDCRDGVYRGTYRVYKNGELVVEKLMTTDVENADCLYFQFSNRGANSNTGTFSFKLDNTLCYTITEDYYGNGLYNDKANDYESGVAFSGGTIVEELNGNKVLELDKKNGKTPSLNIYLDTVQQGSKYVFDTDIQWVDMPLDDYKRTWIGRYGFVSEYTQSYNEDDKFVRSTSMTATPTSGAFLNNSTSGGSLDSTYMKNVKILPGVWYNLRVEYTIDGVDADGYYTGTQSMYLNGELISSSTQKETMMSKYQDTRGVIKNPLGLKGFAFNTLSPNSCAFRLDNTYIGAEGETDLYRYNDFANTVNTASSYPFLGIPTKESCVSEHTIIANPIANDEKSAANNVLKVVTNVRAEGVEKEQRQENKIIRSTDATPAQAHGIYELEFDIAIDPSAALPANNNVFMQFVLSSAGGYVQLYRLTHTGDGNVRFNAETGGSGGGKGGEIGSAKLLDGKWHNVKFVYTKNGTDSSLSIYVDGECIGTKNNCYYMTESAVTKSSVVSEIVWRVKEYVAPEGSEATNTTYYIDNMGFRYAGDLPEN